MVGSRTDERQHLMGVRDRNRAEAELLEELVGDGASGRFGQAAPKLGQRRLEQFEHRRLAPGPAHAGHDPDCARERRSPCAAAGQIRQSDRSGVERRDHRAGARARDLQPGSHPRRDPLHPRPGRPDRPDSQAALRKRDLAAAGRGHQARRGFRSRCRARGIGGDRRSRAARALSRRDARIVHLRIADARRGRPMCSRPARRTRCSHRATRTRSQLPGGER